MDWLLSWLSVVRCRRRLVEWRWRLASAERGRERSMKALEARIAAAESSRRATARLHSRIAAKLSTEREEMERIVTDGKLAVEAARRQHREDEVLIAEIQAENRILQTTIDGLLAQNKTFEVSANAQIANYVRRQVAAAPKVEE